MKNWMKGRLDTLLKKTEANGSTDCMKAWKQQSEDGAYVCSRTCQ